MPARFHITLNEKLYLRDPQATKLGRRIIQHSILLIDELGFEQFTFRKLADRINSTEASIYRYFENKHILMVYLLCFYWEWLHYQIDYHTNNIADPRQRLQRIISVIVNTTKRNPINSFVDEDILHNVVIAEGGKAYHTKEVDNENKEGFYLTYKSLAEKIAEVISEIDPTFEYPRALATNLLEMANDHIFFARHLPRLTDIRLQEGNLDPLEHLLNRFAFGMLRENPVLEELVAAGEEVSQYIEDGNGHKNGQSRK